MNNKERFFWNVEHGLLNGGTDLDRIKVLVDRLIDALYIPVENNSVTKIDRHRAANFCISDGEPINWGSLKCNEVKRFDDGSYLVMIDEASPNNCPTLCRYIEKYMGSWGWEVRVQTEW